MPIDRRIIPIGRRITSDRRIPIGRRIGRRTPIGRHIGRRIHRHRVAGIRITARDSFVDKDFSSDAGLAQEPGEATIRDATFTMSIWPASIGRRVP